MRLLLLIAGICCVIMSVIPAAAQEASSLQYEVVTRLEIPQASGISWSPDGSQLLVIVWPTIQIWDTEHWELLVTISEAYVNSAEWNPTGDMLAGVRGGLNETVLIWDPTTGELIREMTRERPADVPGILILHDLAWSPDGSKIATDSGLSSDLLLIWDLAGNDNPQSLVVGYPEMSGSDWMNIAELEWSQNGRWLLASGSDGNFRSRSIIRLYDAVTGETVRTTFPGFNPIWGPNDEQFAGLTIRGGSYFINIWDVNTGIIQSTFQAHEGGTSNMSWDFDMSFIAGVTNHGLGIREPLIVWDVERRTRHEIEEIQTPFATDIEWQQNGTQLAIPDLYEGVTIINFEFGA